MTPTDRPTDRPTDIVSYRVACTRLKTITTTTTLFSQSPGSFLLADKNINNETISIVNLEEGKENEGTCRFRKREKIVSDSLRIIRENVWSLTFAVCMKMTIFVWDLSHFRANPFHAIAGSWCSFPCVQSRKRSQVKHSIRGDGVFEKNRYFLLSSGRFER